ncbi:MAG TPA: 4Fe-4S dicluster domain-containing protein [Bacillota bacterium]|nr:4Fe-4S dicluster domain-containing protein [Bacillota bacterium]
MNCKRQKIRKALIIISFLLFPVTLNYLSPYLIIEGTAQGIITGSFLVFGILFLSSLFMGRAFCGWVCPGAGLQETCAAVRDRRVTRGNWVKYLIWVPWISLIIWLAVRGHGYRILDPLYRTEHGISVTDAQNFIIFYTVIGLVVILAFTVGRRSFCHHGCWMAPFMILGTKLRNLFKWPALHLKAEPSNCISCKRCTKECPMSLEVDQLIKKERFSHSECILCGNCVDVCPKNVIKYTWKGHD